MKSTSLKYFDTDDTQQISLTTFRAMYIAKLLSLKDLTADEILTVISQNKLLKKICHRDTVINSINSLRDVGFKIDKPRPSNNYRYKLIYSPIKFQLNENEVELLNTIRDSLYYQNDYNILMDVTETYNCLVAHSIANEQSEILENTNYIHNIDKNIISKLIQLCKDKAPIRIIYNSPKYGTEELTIRPQQLVFENNKIYLWVYNYKYKTPAYLRVDKITNINTSYSPIIQNLKEPYKLSTTVEYELNGSAIQRFIPLKNEIITEKCIDKITIKAEVINTFNFIQRIIAFADECKIISPNNIKKLYLEQIDSMIKVYNEKN